MSKFTTEVRYICEQMYGLDESVGADRIDEVVSATADDILGEYPIFDENYREVLNTKIIKHFYTREIGFETVGLWKFHLNNKMNEIMPYYNKLYKSELLDFNPLYDVDLSTQHSSTGSESGNREEEKDAKRSGVKDESTEKSGSVTEETSRNNKESGNENELSARNRKTNEEGSSEQENKEVNSATSSRETENSANGETSGNVEGASSDNTTKGHLDKYLDTPQGSISNLMNGSYLTNARNIDEDEKKNKVSSESSESKSSQSGSEKEESVSGSSSDGKVSGRSSTESEEDESGNRSLNSNRESVGNESKTIGETGSTNKVGSESSSTMERNKAKNFVTSTENYLETIAGKRGSTSYSKLLSEYRDTFLNIDVQIIASLENLFMGIWE